MFSFGQKSPKISQKWLFGRLFLKICGSAKGTKSTKYAIKRD
jgi:hypothetical protein